MVAPSTPARTPRSRRNLQRRYPSVSQQVDGQSSAHTAREREQQPSIGAPDRAASGDAAIVELVGVAGQPHRSFSYSSPRVIQGEEEYPKAGSAPDAMHSVQASNGSPSLRIVLRKCSLPTSDTLDLCDSDADAGTSVVSHPSTPLPPLSGVRRASGGAHVGEDVCASPQAGANTSSAPAYRLTSTTVSDGGLVASKVVEGDGADESSTEQSIHRTRSRTGARAPATNQTHSPAKSSRGGRRPGAGRHVKRDNNNPCWLDKLRVARLHRHSGTKKAANSANDMSVEPAETVLHYEALLEVGKSEKASAAHGGILSQPHLFPRRSERVPSNTDALLLALVAAVISVIADGRCSVASVLLALGNIPDDHCNDAGRQSIDKARAAVGYSLHSSLWNGEREWIEQVPVDLRMPNAMLARTAGVRDRPVLAQLSYSAFPALLTNANKATTHLDHSVFYLASRVYSVGIFVVVPRPTVGNVPLYCRHIGAECSTHIVILHRNRHYECVRWQGSTVFSSSHVLVERLRQLCKTNPPYSYKEDDLELERLEADTQTPQPAAALSAPTPKRAASSASQSQLGGTCLLASRGGSSDTAEQDGKNASSPLRNVERRKVKDEPCRSSRDSPGRASSSTLPTTQAHSLSEPPALSTVVEIASHGPLYDYIGFSSQTQWVSVNMAVWSRYHTASAQGNTSCMVEALIDILLLPAKVLTRLSRGGRASQRRRGAAIKARSKQAAEELRRRFDCEDAEDYNAQLGIVTAPLSSTRHCSTTTSVSTTAETESEGESQAEEETEKREWDRQHEKARVNGSSDSEDGNEQDDAAEHSFLYSHDEADRDPVDLKAVKRAQHHVHQGHLRRAAQTLHSTTTVADLTGAEAQAEMQRLHPSLPVDSVLPSLPADAPEIILEDDDVVRSFIRATNNGASSGPSGWGGNMLSTLVSSDICRGGIIALMRDMINCRLPAEAAELLCASRLVGLNKLGGGIRPIAVGELFYRMAGVIMVRKVSGVAAQLLAPHQYGVGVSSGAERILHSVQHSLTDGSTNKLALLKLDISNAFNSCDRARVLRELYGTSQLSVLFRLTHFAYSAPSQLLLQGCDGKAILSSTGVRQGDPLAPLLFCLYMRDVYRKVAEQADVTLYGFFDDLNVAGTPKEVMAALAALQRLLPSVSLRCNTAKSHFAYFHQADAPLMQSVRDTLAQNNIEEHFEWMELVGGVIGKDDTAIRTGLTSLFGANAGRDAFFRRLQFDELSVQSGMLLLRQSAVPQLNYLLRCTPPVCVAEQAARFDENMLDSARTKLRVGRWERGLLNVTRQLRATLRHGGFGLTSAVQASPAAYLGSLAAVRSCPVFAQYGAKDVLPLPASSQLHGWIASSMKEVQKAAPTCGMFGLLPASASVFFQHFASQSPIVSSSLQSALSKQAKSYQHDATLSAAKEKKKQDMGQALAHVTAITAPRAWTWKNVRPTSAELRLTDTQYRLATRLNLGLSPQCASVGTAVPDQCPFCKKVDAVAKDPWHLLSCNKAIKREVFMRHNQVVNVLWSTALAVGGQAVREPVGLEFDDGRRPDLQLVFPGQHVLTDAVVVHPTAPGYVTNGSSLSVAGAARRLQHVKKQKYMKTAARHEAMLLPFAVETCGGMAPDAVRLLRLIARSGHEQLGMLPEEHIARQLTGAVAMAVQRGTAMVYLSRYVRAVARPAAGGTGEGKDGRLEKHEGRECEKDG